MATTAHQRAMPRPPVRLAKLTPPQAEGLLPRRRLFERFDALPAAPMVWVSAPPGAGKTSLVASWLLDGARPTVWLQLDAADADPASFFHYLGLATQGDDAVPLPLFTPEHAPDPLPFARRYFRSLFQRLQAGTVLVFDNVQEAGADGALAQLLATLVEEQPADVRSVAISRDDPPPALARSRAARQVMLVNAADLQFRPDEARAVAEHCGVTSAALIDRVLAQSQGWAAGIVLLVEALRGAGPLDAAAAQDGGTQAVFDYFATQVFDVAPAALQQALVRLSYLPRMPAALAAELSGDAAVCELLDQLVRRHLFTERRFEPEPTYQFHALFRDFLQAQALRTWGDKTDREWVLRAARLLDTAGHDSDAFLLFVRAAAWDDAARLALARAGGLVDSGRHQTLAGWLGALPMSAREADPWLVYWRGVALTGRDAVASRAELERALVVFERVGDSRGQVRATASLLSGWWNAQDGVRWLEPHAQRLAALLDAVGELDLHTQATGLVTLTLARLMIRPNDPALTGFAQRVSALPFDALPPALSLSAGTCLLQFHWGVGDTHACEVAILRTQRVAERVDLPPGERMWFWFWLMTHRVYMADPLAARAAMAQARAIKDESRRAPPFLDFVRWDVTLELQQGHIREARELLTQQLEPHRPQASPFTQACIDLEWVRCANEEGRFDEAAERGRLAMQVCRAAGHDWLQVVIGLSVCCAQALGGRVEAGFRTLDELRQLSAEPLPILAASVAAYEALLHLRAGSLAAALAALDRCIALRGDTAYVWGPGWNRPAIAELAAFGLAHGRHVPALERFVHGLRLAPPTANVQVWPWPVRICVFDGFVLKVDGDARAGQGRKTAQRLLELLKALAAMGGRDVPVERLCDAVWPDADGDAAQRSLESALSRLRRLLGHDEALQLRAGHLSLNPALVGLDLWAFEHQVRALSALGEGTPHWAEQAAAALHLYRRPLLAGERDAPWLLAERARWRARWITLVNRLAAHHHLNGQAGRLQRVLDAAEVADAADAADPASPAPSTEIVRLLSRYRA